jgi:hypothetical protein
MVLDSDSMMAARLGNLCGFIISRTENTSLNRKENT